MTFNKGLHVPEIGLLTELFKLFIKVKLIKVRTYTLLVLPKNTGLIHVFTHGNPMKA